MIKRHEPSPHVFPLPGAPFMDFYLSLPQDSELKAIVDEALETLKETNLLESSSARRKFQEYTFGNMV